MALQKQKLTKTITGAYTIVLADCGYTIICNSASPFAVTLPSATGLANFNCVIVNVGAGTITCDSKSIYQNCLMFISNNNATSWASIVCDSYGNLITKGTISAGSTKVSVSGSPSGSVFGSGVTIDVPDASTSQKGAVQVGEGLNVSSGTININTNRVTYKYASGTLADSEEGIILCQSATPIILELPSAIGRQGRWYKVVDAGEAGVLINGFNLYSGDSGMVISDGAEWINVSKPKSRILYVQTGDQVITNTTAETTMLDGGIGSLIVPPNSTKVGDTIRIKMYGYISTETPSPTSNVRVKYGGAEIVSASVVLPANLSNQYTEFEILGTARSIGETGTIMVQGRSILGNSSGLSTISLRQFTELTETTVDTTILDAIDVTYEWATASPSNSITITNATIELLRV